MVNVRKKSIRKRVNGILVKKDAEIITDEYREEAMLNNKICQNYMRHNTAKYNLQNIY